MDITFNTLFDNYSTYDIYNDDNFIYYSNQPYSHENFN